MASKNSNRQSLSNIKELVETEEVKNHYQDEAMRLSLLLRIKEICKLRNLKQKDLAKRMQVKPSYLSNILKGKSDMTLSTFNKMIAALEARIEIII